MIPVTEYYWNDRLTVVKDPKLVQFWQVRHPAAAWTYDRHPERRFLLVFSPDRDHATWAAQETRKEILLHDPDFEFDQITTRQRILANKSGGHMHFTSVGAGVMGLQVDEIIISDITGIGKRNPEEALRWVAHIRCRLAHRPLPSGG